MEKKIALALAVLLTVGLSVWAAAAGQQQSDFSAWKREFNMRFESAFEEAYREKIFQANLEAIELHNADPDRSYDQGLNQFSAMTEEEFAQTYLGTYGDKKKEKVVEKDSNMEGDVDWRMKGAVSPVMDERACLAGYAFASVGAVEGLQKIMNKTLVQLSVQEVVDCSTSFGNQHCAGGYMINAYSYIQNTGVTTEANYPYRGVNEPCRQGGGSFRISGYVGVHNCDDLATAILRQPVSVAVDASNWRSYRGGVFSSCGSMLNHGALLTGMNDATWTIKNSWGVNWGESGYIRLMRGNTCGICNDASYPIANN